MRVGIDASNLRQGGGITHLVQLLAAADPKASGVDRVVVWGRPELLDQLVEAPWLHRERPAALSGGGLERVWWRQRHLASLARGSADLLFSPGGTYLGRFRPFVTMFQNMLPFADAERRRYGASKMRLKLEILRIAQRETFRRADGLIFLNEMARKVISDAGVSARHQVVIPHGLEPRFFSTVKPQRPIVEYSESRPFKWLYVSAIHDYKRPWNVAEAVAAVRQQGVPVTLDLVGPAYPPAMRRLQQTLDR